MTPIIVYTPDGNYFPAIQALQDLGYKFHPLVSKQVRMGLGPNTHAVYGTSDGSIFRKTTTSPSLGEGDHFKEMRVDTRYVLVEPPEKIKIGSKWQHSDGETYLLCQVDVREVTLIDLEKANRFTHPVSVEDQFDITPKEWAAITERCANEFTRMEE